jgi:hypothetical protein
VQIHTAHALAWCTAPRDPHETHSSNNDLQRLATMKILYKLLLAAAPVLLVAACGGGDDSIDDRLNLADPKVRFVHAAPLTAPLSVTRNGVAQPDATGVAYTGASNYYDVSTGTATWRVATTTGNAQVGTLDFDAGRGGKYTLVAVPDLSLTGAELVFISDPYNKELTANNARARVLHAGANSTGSLDVYLRPAGTDIGTITPDFPGVGYKSASPASGSDSIDVTVGSGAYELTITPAGSKTPYFRAPVTVMNNADWLITILPDSATPNDLKVLLVKANDASATQEIANTLP